MSDGELTIAAYNNCRTRLKREIDSLEPALKAVNEKNRAAVDASKPMLLSDCMQQYSDLTERSFKNDEPTNKKNSLLFMKK